MTVLDAYAVLAYLRGEVGAGEVAALLRSPTVLCVLNAAEVMDQLVRVYGRDPDDVEADLALLSQAGMALAPVSVEVAFLAGRLRARNYHRENMALSLADCVATATALSGGRRLATADPALARLLRREGGEVEALPDSLGSRP